MLKLIKQCNNKLSNIKNVKSIFNINGIPIFKINDILDNDKVLFACKCYFSYLI